jgi:hypothetical protein
MPISTIGTNGLTTPLPASNLGTPSAINLSNATALAKAALPSGSVLQVVNGTTLSATNTSSTSFVSTSLFATITPTSSASNVLILCSYAAFGLYNGGDYCIGTIFRNSTNLGGGTYSALSSVGSYAWGLNQGYDVYTNIMHLDAPSTTSAQTYRLYIKSYAGQSVYANDSAWRSSITLLEIAV